MLRSAKVVPDSVPIGQLIHPTHWPPAPLSYRAPKRQHPGVDNPGHRQPRRQSLKIPYIILYTDSSPYQPPTTPHSVTPLSQQEHAPPSRPLASQATPQHPRYLPMVITPPPPPLTPPSPTQTTALPSSCPPCAYQSAAQSQPQPLSKPTHTQVTYPKLLTIPIRPVPVRSALTLPLTLPPKPLLAAPPPSNRDTPSQTQHPRPGLAEPGGIKPKRLTGNNPDTSSYPPRSCANTGCSCVRLLGRGRGIRFGIFCWSEGVSFSSFQLPFGGRGRTN